MVLRCALRARELRYKHQLDTKPIHINIYFFCLDTKGAIYHAADRVAIATVTFSRVKMSCFRAKAHLVFRWCLYNTLKSVRVPSQFASFQLL